MPNIRVLSKLRWLSKSKVIEGFWNVNVSVIMNLVNLNSEKYRKFLTNN